MRTALSAALIGLSALVGDGAVYVDAPWRGNADPAAQVSDADRAAIAKVIRGQLQAFRDDDAARAFSFAAPAIQAQFGSPTRFMAVVQSSYLPVYRPRSVAFGDLATIDGRLTQNVRLEGPDGEPVSALYFMEREADGTWRIGGCVLTEDDSLGT
jgi:hypothetical protein